MVRYLSVFVSSEMPEKISHSRLLIARQCYQNCCSRMLIVACDSAARHNEIHDSNGHSVQCDAFTCNCANFVTFSPLCVQKFL